MRAYETAFLIAPTLPDEELEALIQSMAEVVEKNAGKMDNLDRWGKRRLAYPIKKFGEAYYVFFLYHSEPVVPSELDRHFKQTESVIRHMTFVLDERDNVRLKKKGTGKKTRRPRQEERNESPRQEERAEKPLLPSENSEPAETSTDEEN
ncbi:MAG: 30S ribosomal protein S6 [Acidobacteria bacterium]|nr:30S ribosomal protein S6 [Acidobacteriota bacterium]